MRLLLDTHALLWAVAAPEELGPRVRALLEDGRTQVFVSAVSAWEIAIKVGMGKLELELSTLLAELAALGFAELDVTLGHARRVDTLPALHRDPFDRMLVAQALEEGMTLVTRDPALGRYAAPTLWE